MLSRHDELVIDKANVDYDKMNSRISTHSERRITDWDKIQSTLSTEPQKKPSKAEEFRKMASEHISKGVNELLTAIYSRIEAESKSGKFQLTHFIKPDQSVFKMQVIQNLKNEGFSVEVSPTSQRDPEISLKIEW